MDAILERCRGLDVHRDTVVACCLTGALDERPKKEVRTFSTMSKGLHELLEWLELEKISDVAMESTGIYWKPVYCVLEGNFELKVANAQRIKNVPGRKTDISDAEWIAKLLRSGLISGSFVPPQDLLATPVPRKTGYKSCQNPLESSYPLLCQMYLKYQDERYYFSC